MWRRLEFHYRVEYCRGVGHVAFRCALRFGFWEWSLREREYGFWSGDRIGGANPILLRNKD